MNNVSCCKKYTYTLLLIAGWLFFSHFTAKAQPGRQHFFSGTWIELKAGTGLLLHVVPLSVDNGLQLKLPGGEFGTSAELSMKHAFRSGLFMGYQLDYLFVKGNLSGINGNSVHRNTDVPSHVVGNNLILGWQLRKPGSGEYRFNYRMFYKIGAITLVVSDVSSENEDNAQKISLSDAGVGVLTGVGAEIHFQMNQWLGIVGSAGFNHISSTISEVYRPHKMFGNNPYTVSNYPTITLGVSYKLPCNPTFKKKLVYNSKTGNGKQTDLPFMPKIK